MALQRVDSIDLTRGLIMVIMAIDHAAIFIGGKNYIEGIPWFDPSKIHIYTSPLPFLTRYLPGICAPGFAFLMGMSMVLFHESRKSAGWNANKSVVYFTKRGMLLIILQFTWENLLWCLADYPFFPLYFGILSALGCIMIIASPAIRLPAAALLALSGIVQVIYFAAMNKVTLWENAAQIPSILKIITFPGKDDVIDVYFPIIPWLTFTLAGMASGKFLLQDRAAFFRWLPIAGIALLALSIPLRLLGGVLFNFVEIPLSDGMSFFYGTKYPPGASYQCYNLGIVLIVFALFEKMADSRFMPYLKPLRILGKSALFFYLVHLVVFALFGLPFQPEGLGLEAVYLGFVVGIALMIPLCELFSRFKNSRTPDSLWRMF